MIQCLARALHSRWRRFVEVTVYRPVRGVIDMVLHDPLEPVLISTEAQSELRRIEQQVRWARAKSDALASTGASELAGVLQAADGRPSDVAVSRLLLLRSSTATHRAAAMYSDLLAAAYPARHADAVAALTGTAPWPGAALVWMDVANGIATLKAAPPRGIRLGR